MAHANKAVTPDEIIFDQWTPLSFKHVLSDNRPNGAGWLAPTWVGKHQRRLQAYKVLHSYMENSSRFFLETTDQELIEARREYGDAELIVSTIVDALLGDDLKFVVEGAEQTDDEAKRARAIELQEWLQDWAKKELLAAHIQEVEHDAVGLGDGIYVASWSATKNRPRIQTFDPGMYFPVLWVENAADQDYPRTVHIAWEEETNDPRKYRVRRISWRMGLIQPETGIDADGQPVYLVNDDGTPRIRPGDAVDNEGFITRQLPWRDEPTRETCYMTDATWILERLNADIEDFSGATAIYNIDEEGRVIRDLDLGFDFIPLIHLPNTVAKRTHYGRSSLSVVLQILDDLMGVDTDLQAASATTGTPPIALKNATLETENGKLRTYGPGTVFETGDGGMDILDTSRSLDALLKYATSLLERLSTNSRVPQSVLGRVRPSEVPSGIALALSFGPLESMVRKMRQSREEKYPLLLTFVMRLAQLGGLITDGEILPARVEFGSYLPSDKQTTVQNVTLLLQNKAISLQTAIQMLIEAGFPIDDAGAELERIREEAEEAMQRQIEAAEATAKIEQDNVRTRPGDQNGPPRPPQPDKGAPTRRGGPDTR